MIYLQALAIALFMAAVIRLGTRLIIWPDSQHYIKLGTGQLPPGPFCRRWLLPLVCGSSIPRWTLAAWVSVAASALLLTHLAGTPKAALLLMGLYGLVWMGIIGPVLTDLPAFALALGSVASLEAGWWPLAILFALAAGACKETAPFFAAAWSLSPLLLAVALASTVLLFVAGRWWGGDDEKDPWLTSDLRKLFTLARQTHSFLDPLKMLLPFGALVILAPISIATFGVDRLAIAAIISLALGYGQLLVASDESRLMQWATPPLVLLACRVDAPWVWPLLLVHVFAPGRNP